MNLEQRIINFIKRIAQHSCSICCDSCLSCDAVELLREIEKTGGNDCQIPESTL